MKYFLATLIIMITLPLVAQAEVRINEIAWMGVTTTNGQYGEWFELYNTGNETVNLSGWKLYKAGGAKLIYAFTGSIAPGEYYVVERTTASIADPLPEISNEQGVFSNSGFANTGEFLVLKDAQGQVVQSLDHSSGWQAGDTTSKDTMQYSSNNWITAASTPGKVNSTTPIISSPSTNLQDETENSEETPLYTTEQGTDTGVRTKESQEKIVPLLVRARKDPHIDFTFPSTVYASNVHTFIGAITLEYSTPTTGEFVWNMGDGTVLRYTENTPITHVYRYSGTYMVTLSYYPTERYGTPVLWASKKVTVVDPQLTLRILDSQTLQISNRSDTPLDLSHWVITTGNESAVVPDMTLLAAQATIGLSTKHLSLPSLTTASLLTMNGTLVASTTISSVQQTIGKIAKVLSLRSTPSAGAAEVSEDPAEEYIEQVPIKQNRTKSVVIGAAVVVMLVSLLGIERFIAYRQEQ